MDAADILANDPRQQASWRYLRALELSRTTKARASRHDDPEAVKFAKYLLHKRQLSTVDVSATTMNRMLATRWGPYWLADRLFTDGEARETRSNGEDDRMRSELEGRILARQNDVEIAELLGVPDTAIRVYHDIFFAVRPRLNHKMWIGTQVIGPVIQGGETPWRHDLLVRYFGYFGGPDVLNIVINGLDNHGLEITNPNDVGEMLDRIFTLRFKTTVNMFLMRYVPTRYEFQDLIGGYVSLLSLAQRQRESEGTQNILTDALQIMQERTPLYMGQKQEIGVIEASGYTNKSIEPRIHEVAQIAANGSVPETLVDYNAAAWKPPKYVDTADVKKRDGKKATKSGNGDR